MKHVCSLRQFDSSSPYKQSFLPLQTNFAGIQIDVEIHSYSIPILHCFCSMQVRLSGDKMLFDGQVHME